MATWQRPALAVFLIVVAPTLASAQWAVNGNPVCTATGAQNTISIAPDGLGDAVMVWQDNRGSSTDIYCRQISPLGAATWTSNGVPLCTAANGQQSPRVVYDGLGHLIYTWEDFRGGTADMYAAVTDRFGNVLTPADGFAVAATTGDQHYAALAANQGLGVAYLAWTDTRNGNNDIYAQAFNHLNHGFWTGNGLAFCTNASDQVFPAVTFDSFLDGAIVAWQDFRNGNYDIYAQRANLSGTLFWAANGAPVCTSAAAQTSPMIISDGAGGAIIAWQDQRHGVFVGAIYAQRLNGAGVPQWTANGVPIAISTDLIILPHMIPDGAGGALFGWEDDRNISTTGADIYVQRVNASGTVLWTANGVPISTAAFSQNVVDIASDGANGLVAIWQDFRSLGPTDIYAQRVNSAGTPLWTANGMPICLASANQFNVAITSEGGAAIAAWEDRRTSTAGDVYAQRIDIGSGQIGHPQPTITSIVDVPNDQGGAVRMTFVAGDGQPSGEEYEIFDVQYHGGDVVYVGTWNGSPSYTVDVLTEGVGVPNSYYISAAFISDQVSGTSIDNLAPPAPTLAGQRNGANVSLTWNATAGDIGSYTIQRSDVGVLTTVSTTAYTDLNVPSFELHYRMWATDIHANAGPLSNELIIPLATAAEAAPSGPRVFTLIPNSPNPFSGTTTFKVGMPKSGDVRLDVYDLAGRRVASHGYGLVASGWHDLMLDGRDDGGHPLASGVYFYQVRAGDQTQRSKMVIRR